MYGAPLKDNNGATAAKLMALAYGRTTTPASPWHVDQAVSYPQFLRKLSVEDVLALVRHRAKLCNMPPGQFLRSATTSAGSMQKFLLEVLCAQPCDRDDKRPLQEFADSPEALADLLAQAKKLVVTDSAKREQARAADTARLRMADVVGKMRTEDKQMLQAVLTHPACAQRAKEVIEQHQQPPEKGKGKGKGRGEGRTKGGGGGGGGGDGGGLLLALLAEPAVRRCADGEYGAAAVEALAERVACLAGALQARRKGAARLHLLAHGQVREWRPPLPECFLGYT